MANKIVLQETKISSIQEDSALPCQILLRSQERKSTSFGFIYVKAIGDSGEKQLT